MKIKLRNNRNQPQRHKGTNLKNRYIIILGVLVPWWQERNGSVLLITIFAIALLSVLVMGMLQMNTEEIQLMQNHIWATQALCIAEAGLNHALSEIREDDEWDDEIEGEPFAGGSYSVEVDGDLPNLTIESEGTSSQGFNAKVEADITVDTNGSSDHAIRIDNLRINE